MGVGVHVLAVVGRAEVDAVGDHPAQHVVSQLAASVLPDAALGQLARHRRPPAPVARCSKIHFTHLASGVWMTRRLSV